MSTRFGPDWITAIATVVALGISLLALWISHLAGKRQERMSAASMESQRTVAAEALLSQERMAAAAMANQQTMFREELKESLRQATNLQLFSGRNALYADLLQVSAEQPEGTQLVERLSALAGRVEVFASREVTRTFHRIQGKVEFEKIMGPGGYGEAADGSDFEELAAKVKTSKAATSVVVSSGQNIRESDRLENDDESATSKEVPHPEGGPPAAVQE